MNNSNDEIILHKNQQQFDEIINDYEDKIENKYTKADKAIDCSWFKGKK